MPDSKISALTAATTLALTDEFVIATGGASKKATLDTVLATATILTPTIDARNVIQPSAATVKALVLKGAASQSDSLLELQDSAGAVLGSLDSAGRVRAPLGSLSEVGIGFSGDPNTGLYSAVADTVSLVAGGAEAVRALATKRLVGGTYRSTHSIELDLSDSAPWPSASYFYPGGGIFRAAEVGIAGTDDIFFQGIPATAAGFTYLESWTGAGLILGTGNADKTISIRPNRVESAFFEGSGAGMRKLVLKAAASQTARIFEALNSSSALLMGIDAAGLLAWVSGNEQTTVGAAGGASAPPATPTKYLKVKDSAGTTLVIPAYAAA